MVIDKYQLTTIILINMGKRITIMLDDELVAKLRIIQAKNIRLLAEYVSFSKIINMELKAALK